MIQEEKNATKKEKTLTAFNKRLVEIMDKRGMTQAQLAKLTDLSPSRIHHYRIGTVGSPGVRVLGLLSGALEVNPLWLRGDVDGPIELSESGEEFNSALRQLKDEAENLPPAPPEKEWLMDLEAACRLLEERPVERGSFIECFLNYVKLDDEDRAEIRGEIRQLLKAGKYREF